jgi:hypothetical protein
VATLQLLWTEYRAAHPTGYAYSYFCECYRHWAQALKPSMRQVRRAGEKLFIDFSGTRTGSDPVRRAMASGTSARPGLSSTTAVRAASAGMRTG